jgi:hypothetical protein
VKDIGFFALYPIGNRYLVHIQSADPRDMRGPCPKQSTTGADISPKSPSST